LLTYDPKEALSNSGVPCVLVSCKCDVPAYSWQIEMSTIERLSRNNGGLDMYQTSINTADSQKKCISIILRTILTTKAAGEWAALQHVTSIRFFSLCNENPRFIKFPLPSHSRALEICSHHRSFETLFFRPPVLFAFLSPHANHISVPYPCSVGDPKPHQCLRTSRHYINICNSESHVVHWICPV
jgi:hypothetical protein